MTLSTASGRLRAELLSVMLRFLPAFGACAEPAEHYTGGTSRLFSERGWN